VVNGALEYLAKDLGIAENTVLQGKYMMIHFFTPPVNGKMIRVLISSQTHNWYSL